MKSSSKFRVINLCFAHKFNLYTIFYRKTFTLITFTFLDKNKTP
nr:MAG TPA: hypothetical protein [Caudoviricetes sp.]